MGSGLAEVSGKLQAVIQDLTTYEDLLSQSSRRLDQLSVSLTEAVGASRQYETVGSTVAAAQRSVRGTVEAVGKAKEAARKYTAEATTYGGSAGSGAATVPLGAIASPPTLAAEPWTGTAAGSAATGAGAAEGSADAAAAPEAGGGQADVGSSKPSFRENMLRRWENLPKTLGLKNQNQLDEAKAKKIEGKDIFNTRRNLRAHFTAHPENAFAAKLQLRNPRNAAMHFLHTDDSLQSLSNRQTIKLLTSELEKMESGVSELAGVDLAAHRVKVEGWLARFHELSGSPLEPYPPDSLKELLALTEEIKQEFPERPKVSLADLILQADPGMAAIYVGRLVGTLVSRMLTPVSGPVGISAKILTKTLSNTAMEAYKHRHSCLTRDKNPPPLGKLLGTNFVTQIGLASAVELGLNLAIPFLRDVLEQQGKTITKDLLVRAVQMGIRRPGTPVWEI